MHILALIYAFKSFLHIKAHQSYEKGFMAYLETIAFEKHWGFQDIKWIDIKTP